MSIPSGTITFLFTDIEGSTALWESEPDAMREALAWHDRALAGVITSNSGDLFKSAGDALFAAFATAPSAISAALECQIALSESPHALTLPVRMALYTGAADARDGDYYGVPLNRASRLLEAAHGGQVLVSRASAALADGQLPSECTLRDLKMHRLKDLQQPEHIYQLHHPALRAEFPPLRTLENHPNNLPRQTSTFIGRGKEIEQVKRLLSETCILTLTGSGGSGKTRLALQAAAQVLEAYEDGVWLVELAPLSDPGLIPQAIAAVFNIRAEADVSETLTTTLREKRLLLILDNCEHMREGCARLANVLLRSCPNLSILATSREALGVPGETTWIVPSLELPDPDRFSSIKRLSQYEAIALFLARARSARPDFDLENREQAQECARLCSTLEGIPLAMELAAAWVATLSLQQISSRLSVCMSTPVRPAPDPRQETLAATIDWSCNLLTAAERKLLMRLTVFCGGWTMEAAEAVCESSPDSMQVISLLPLLVRKSLVKAEHQPGGGMRYRMLETIREYLKQGTDQPDELSEVRDSHRDYFLALAEEAEHKLGGPEQNAWLDRLDLEIDNIRAALAWSLSAEPRLKISAALWRFWYMRGYLAEGRSWLEGPLSSGQPVSTSVRSRALNAAGVLATREGDFSAARRHYAECLISLADSTEKRHTAAITANLGVVAWSDADDNDAKQQFERALALYRDCGDKAGVAAMLNNLGCLELEAGNYDKAMELLQEGYDTWIALGDTAGAHNALGNIAEVALGLREAERAETLFKQSLLVGRRIKDYAQLETSVLGLARVAFTHGELERAATLLGAMEAVASRIKIKQRERIVTSARANQVEVQRQLNPDAFASAFNRGRAMDLEETFAYCLGETG